MFDFFPLIRLLRKEALLFFASCRASATAAGRFANRFLYSAASKAGCLEASAKLKELELPVRAGAAGMDVDEEAGVRGIDFEFDRDLLLLNIFRNILMRVLASFVLALVISLSLILSVLPLQLLLKVSEGDLKREISATGTICSQS